MIGEDDECQPGARGGGGDDVGCAAAVGLVRVNVQNPWNRAVAAGQWIEREARRRQDEEG